MRHWVQSPRKGKGKEKKEVNKAKVLDKFNVSIKFSKLSVTARTNLSSIVILGIPIHCLNGILVIKEALGL